MTKALTVPAAIEKAVRILGMPTAVHRRVTKEEVDRARALAIAARDDRLRILIDFLWFTGARISEVLALRVEDVDWSHRSVSMPTLKRRQDDPAKVPRRGLPLPTAFLGELVVYVHEHQLTSKSAFIDIKRIMSWRALKRVLLAAGVDKERAFPHAFRHGHALHALSEGVPINVVQLTLGHTSILTTQIYVRATGKDIERAYERVVW